MRKLLRAKMHHKAEKTKGKTIKVFHYLWKEYLKKQGKSNVIKDHRSKTKKYAW